LIEIGLSALCGFSPSVRLSVRHASDPRLIASTYPNVFRTVR